MNRRTVLFFIPTLAPGGTERQLLYLAGGLAASHDVRVVCTGQPGAWADRLPSAVSCIALGCRSGWDPRLPARAFNAIRDAAPEVVHSFMFGFDYAINVAARRAGVPVVVSSRRQLATWKRRRHLALQRQANERVDAIIANARAVADFAQRQEGSPPGLYRVIPNGIDAGRFEGADGCSDLRRELNLPTDAPVLGMVANFSPVKNHALFLEILQTLARHRRELRFLLVGDGPLRDGFQRNLRKMGLRDRVRIVQGDAARYYAGMTVSVLCSNVEGFPNAALESMAAWVPFVGPAVGGVPELIEDGETGILVPGRTAAGFANAIAWLLDRPAERRRLAARAKEFVAKRYSVEAMVAAHAALYAELFARHQDEAA